jgi:ubiquinone/menaquinone biosynthesis C-methylase UbiE
MGGSLRCVRCARFYRLTDGYVEVMPDWSSDHGEASAPGDSPHTSAYVAHEEEFAAALDYRRIGPPVLGAGVRQRAIRRMLNPQPSDTLIELGCGNGKFVYWNRRSVAWAVGIDPAPLFAREALDAVDLCQADARSLPFASSTFSAAMSIDVLEHLPMPDIEAYLREAHRVLSPGGRLFLYSNTREPSRLDFVVRGARRLSSWLGQHGVIDNSRDLLRKGDHVKAIETYPQLEATLERCGFSVEQVRFWNGLFQSTIENLLVKLAESFLRRRKGAPGKASETTGASGEDALRSSVRGRLSIRGPMYQMMRVFTNLMWLDIALFGSWRAGPYFLLARRVDPDLPQEPWK